MLQLPMPVNSSPKEFVFEVRVRFDLGTSWLETAPTNLTICKCFVTYLSPFNIHVRLLYEIYKAYHAVFCSDSICIACRNVLVGLSMVTVDRETMESHSFHRTFATSAGMCIASIQYWIPNPVWLVFTVPVGYKHVLWGFYWSYWDGVGLDGLKLGVHCMPDSTTLLVQYSNRITNL